jgi:signal transduction histidine kinase
VTTSKTGEPGERRERELRNLREETERLRRRLVLLSNLSRRIASSLQLNEVFQDVIDAACELTAARYGALAIFDATGRVEQFITRGLTPEERERIGRLPEGLGILGWLHDLQEPLRLGDLASHPRSAGFPAHHPAMRSFLGAPIRHGGEALGNVYLTEKEGGADFTPEDESLLVLFAAQAAMAIRNAQLHRQVQDLVVLEERDRIAMDLHDGVIQSLYAIGLKLETCLEDVAKDPETVAADLQTSIEQLNQVIGDVRSYIFQLRPAALSGTDLGGAVGSLLQELKVNALLQVELDERPGACAGLSEEQTRALFQIAREALANARKHARARRVSARLEQEHGVFRMTITDDGDGFDPGRGGRGQGLRNMRERTAALGGELAVASGNGRGTCVTLSLPLAKGG